MKNRIALALFGLVLSLNSFVYAGDTNCEKTGVSTILISEYARATHAWCQNNSKATYILSTLLLAMAENKADFTAGSGDLIYASGFTALALAGYKLDSGMLHQSAGKKYISVHFTDTDPTNDIKYYSATFEVRDSVYGNLPRK